MLAKTKVCVLTCSRAEYGQQRVLWRTLAEDPKVHLQVLVAGAHWSSTYGGSAQHILDDGFEIHEKVDYLQAGNSPLDVARSMGRAVTGFAETFSRLAPDALVLLGDRFETLAAAEAAALLRVPIAHLHGGEITEGALDDGFRHAITKLAHLHFVDDAACARRVLRMGEEPWRVHAVGALARETIALFPRWERARLEQVLGWTWSNPLYTVIVHPESQASSPLRVFHALLAVLETLPGASFAFLGSNADAHSREISASARAFVGERPERARYFETLPHDVFLNLLLRAEALLGNSSCGVVEAPCLGIFSVDIGDRQKGRNKEQTVFPARPEPASIQQALQCVREAPRRTCARAVPSTARKVVDTLLSFQADRLLAKKFYEGDAP